MDGADHQPKKGLSIGNVADFGEAVFDSAIQSPINGVRQIMGLPEVHWVDYDKDTYLAKTGGLLGTVMDYFALSTASHYIEVPLGLTKFTQTSLGAGLKMGALGTLYGGVLTPNEGPGLNVDARIRSGAITGLTLGALTAFTTHSPLDPKSVEGPHVTTAEGKPIKPMSFETISTINAFASPIGSVLKSGGTDAFDSGRAAALRSIALKGGVISASTVISSEEKRVFSSLLGDKGNNRLPIFSSNETQARSITGYGSSGMRIPTFATIRANAQAAPISEVQGLNK